MPKIEIATGVVHKVPADLRQAFETDSKIKIAWNKLTPLARNEWICWIISVKKSETRERHIKRTISDLKAGKRRPCCWMGCIHRTDKPISPSIQFIVNKRSKNIENKKY